MAGCIECATCVPWKADLGCCDEWETLATDLQIRSLDLAWSALRTLTAGQVGACAVVARPCLRPPCDACQAWDWQPRIVDGVWINDPCGPPRCWCERVCEIVVGGRVARINEITVDGEVLDPAAYRVDNGHRIVRTDGQCWPGCQFLDRDLSEPGTLGVEYVPGIVPSPAALWAAGVLACEFAKACTGGKCRLPSSVTAIARQGVSMSFTEGMFAGNITGIREVDAFVWSINPNGLRAAPTVWSPDAAWAQHRYEPPRIKPNEIEINWCAGESVVRTVTLYGVVPKGWDGVYTAPIYDLAGVGYGSFDVAKTVLGDDLQLVLSLAASTSANIGPGDYRFELIQDGVTTRLRGLSTVGTLVAA